MKDQVITDEVFTQFMDSIRPNMEKWWKEFKASHQPPNNEWDVVEFKNKKGTFSKWDENIQFYKSRKHWILHLLNCGADPYRVLRTDTTTLEVGKEYLFAGIEEKAKVLGFNYNSETNNLSVWGNHSYENERRGGFCYSLSLLKDIVECKEVLFTASDGTAFHSLNDRVWLVQCKDGYYWKSAWAVDSIADVTYSFSCPLNKPELADNYIKENTRDKSLAMIREALEQIGWTKEKITGLMNAVGPVLAKRLKAYSNGG